MALETVSSRTTGEVPTASELNELLVALKDLFNTSSLPPSAFPWPLVAAGNINMNGFSVLNQSSTAGVVNVNSGTPLTSAASTINSSVGGGTIVIDAGYAATTSASGVVFTKPVTIRGEGGASIDIANLTVAGEAIGVTSDNVTFENIEFVQTGAGTNVNDSILVDGSAGFTLKNCWFTDVLGSVTIGISGGTTCLGPQITNNYSTGHKSDFIKIVNADAPHVIDNTGDTISAGFKYVSGVATNSPSRGVVTGNSLSAVAAGADGIVFSSGAYTNWIIDNNTVDVPGTALSCTAFDHSPIRGNSLVGDVTLSSLFDSPITGNYVDGALALSSLTNCPFNTNNVGGSSTFTMTTCTRVPFSGNVIVPTVDFSPNVMGLTIMGNTLLNIPTLPPLLNNAVSTFVGNYCPNGVTNDGIGHATRQESSNWT